LIVIEYRKGKEFFLYLFLLFKINTDMKQKMNFLPMSLEEMNALGWNQCDIILITGDAYVDHPSFGAAIIGRYLESLGYKVGVIAQPDWHSDDDFKKLGPPRLFFGVTSGNMDSMVNHYTAQKKIRSKDMYSPDSRMGLRPDRAVIIYTQILKRLFKSVPVVLGGIEASMRRIPHYDYWSDKVRNSLLLDSKADILVYGMGEKPIRDIAKQLDSGTSVNDMKNIPGTVVTVQIPDTEKPVILPSLEESLEPRGFYHMSKTFHENYRQSPLYQPFAGRYLKHNQPTEPMSEKEMDAIYSLPFQRQPHPAYNGMEIPAFVQIRDSITSHRGCFGGCRFCTIGYHQGKQIQSRSQQFILNEIDDISHQKYYHGTISDVGGPSANMYGMYCSKHLEKTCKRDSCLYPDVCSLLHSSHDRQRKMIHAAHSHPAIKHLFIASGIRFDLSVNADDYIDDLAQFFIGGHLKLAPEHTNSLVLNAMGKPDISVYENFCRKFEKESHKMHKNQMVIPYIIVGHPGSGLKEGLDLALYLLKNNIRLEQIQEFTPTPMTLSTCMYFTGMDWETGKPIHVPKGREIRLQKALAQWFMPENRKYVMEALHKVHRSELMNQFYPIRKKSH